MVVSEEVKPNSTTTENAEKETSSLLTLNYDLPTQNNDDSTNPMEILAETSIKDEIVSSDIFVENIEDTKTEPKVITLEKKENIETGIEIFYTSMKLKNLPIKESNISSYNKEVEQIGLNNTTVHVGTTPLFNVNVRIVGYGKFKIIEFKTREFKLGLSIKLENDVIQKDGDYFKYEIFSKLKNSRFISVCEIIKNIFSGTQISFDIKDLHGNIVVENPIQSHKFGMIIESIKKYENIEKKLSISKTKVFSDTSMDFYTLHLLDSYLNGKSTLSSWLNFRIENNNSIQEGDSLIFIKEHDLDFRGINYLLKETIIIKDSVSNKDIDLKNNSITGYRKLIEIHLEKIEK